MSAVPDAASELPAVWLGTVETANNIYVQLAPQFGFESGTWRPLSELPPGIPRARSVRVAASEPNRSSLRGQGYWTFRLQPKVGARSTLEAVAVRRAIPIIDLSDVEVEAARRKVVEDGVNLPPHGIRQAVVLLPDDTYCLLKFEQADTPPKLWRAKVNAGRVEIRRADPSWKQSAASNGWKYFPSVDEPNGELVATADWQPNDEFLEQVLRRYREAVAGFSHVAGSAKDGALQVIDKAAKEVSTLAGHAEDLRRISTRLKDEWPSITDSLGALRDIGSLLLDSAGGQAALAAAIRARTEEEAQRIERAAREQAALVVRQLDAEIERLRATTRSTQAEGEQARMELGTTRAALSTALASAQDADARLKRSERDLAKIRQDSQRVTAERDDAAAAAAAARAQVDAATAGLDAVRGTVDEFARQVESAFADTAVGLGGDARVLGLIQRLQAAFDRTGHQLVVSLPSAVPPWWSASGNSGATTIGRSGVKQRLTEEAKAYGLVQDDLWLLDVFTRAGELVIVTGADADLAVEAFARTVSGGRVHNQALDPATIGVDDLWRSAATQTPTAFAHAWHAAAQHPEQTVLVCLRSIDASPARLWIPALSTFLADTQRPGNLLVVATAPSAVGAPQDTDESRTALRHHAIGLRPRPSNKAGTCQVALGGRRPSPTTLRHEHQPPSMPDVDTVDAIAAKAVHPSIARRAVRVLPVLTEHLGSTAASVAAAWADCLNTGVPNGLPAPLVDGYANLSTLDSRP
jgi:hypothetical protein